jgi:hypothetical protein
MWTGRQWVSPTTGTPNLYGSILPNVPKVPKVPNVPKVPKKQKGFSKNSDNPSQQQQ